MKATITDIAKATGLSVSTVSKYLNQKSVLFLKIEKKYRRGY